MKRILILAYDFPPLSSAGAARPYGWYLYMKKYGFDPVIVTRKWAVDMQTELDILQAGVQNGTEIELTEYGTLIKVDYIPNMRDHWSGRKQNFLSVGIRKLLSLIYKYLPFITFRDDATRNIYREAEKYLKENEIDLILATGGPFHLFRYASKLSSKYDIPWVADFRDLWSYYPNHGLGFMSEVVEKRIKRVFENTYLKTAEALVTVTKPCADILQEAHQKSVFLSLNGYIDYGSKKSENNSVPADRKQLKIAYIGTLYEYYQLDEFFKGFNAYAKNESNVSLTFIGMDFYPAQKKKIRSLSKENSENICFTERLTADMLQEKLEEYDVLLLFGKENGLSIHVKLFEYLLLSKPVLLFGKNNQVMGEIIRDTAAGYICETSEELYDLLGQLQQEKFSNETLNRKVLNIEKYSRESQTEKLVDFLNAQMKIT